MVKEYKLINDRHSLISSVMRDYSLFNMNRILDRVTQSYYSLAHSFSESDLSASVGALNPIVLNGGAMPAGSYKKLHILPTGFTFSISLLKRIINSFCNAGV